VKLKNCFAFIQALMALAIFAHGQDVHYNYDRSANFASYKTYQWVELPNQVSDQLIDRDVKRSIDEQLAQKGLTKVDKGGDLYVAYQAAVGLEKGVDLTTMSLGGWGDRTVRGQTTSIPVGMLVVDVYDSAKKQLIWRGDATKSIDLNKDPNKNYKNLEKAMAKLFKNYPPQASK